MTNGSKVLIRDCYVYPFQGGPKCSNSTACAQSNQSLPVGVEFKSCSAECCPDNKCNRNLMPIPRQPVLSSMTPRLTGTNTAMASRSANATYIAHSSASHANETGVAPKGPTSTGANIKASFYTGPFWMILAHIMS